MTHLASGFFCVASTAVVAAMAAWPSSADDQDEPGPPASCVRTESIDDWSPVDKWSMVVRTGPSHSYEVTFAAPCRRMKWSVLTRVDVPATRASTCLSPGDAVLFGRGARRPDNTFEYEDRCLVKSVEPAPTQETALSPSG